MFEWLSARNTVLVYAFLFLNSSFESLFPPYPSDAFVLVFAFIAGQGNFNPYAVYFFVVSGAVTGIMVLYYIGKTKGNALIQFMARSLLGKIFPVKMIEKAKSEFTKRGDLIVLLNRFLPGMRAPICFTAGIVNINTRRFFWFSLASVLAWNFFLLMVGFYVGSNWDEASVFLRRYNIIVASVVLLGLAISAILYFHRTRKS